jgi:PleD family two-component response regulator
MKTGEDDKEMNAFAFSELSHRVLLSSDNHHLVSPLRNALLKAGFNVDLASDYSHLELLWQQLRHDIVLFEVSQSTSIEAATEAAVRIKRQDAQQFIAYLADANLQGSGLIGDAIFSRDADRLPSALRAALDQEP